MTVYVDASVLLRLLLGEPQPLKEWRAIQRALASRLLRLEVARVIDRLRLEGNLTDEQVALVRREARRLYGSIEFLGLSDGILRRAEDAFSTVIGTLDAIHLATALQLARSRDASLRLATHDVQLARAARASGIEVIGA